MNIVRSGAAGQPLAALASPPRSLVRRCPPARFPRVLALATLGLVALTGCNSYVSPIDFAGSGKGVPLQQLTSGPLSDEQLRAIAEVSTGIMLVKNPPPGAAPGMAGHRPSGPSDADIAKFETQLQPIFLNVAQQYAAVADQAKARGVAGQPYVESEWRSYNELLHRADVPQSEVNNRCLQLTAQLSGETLRLREALK